MFCLRLGFFSVFSGFVCVSVLVCIFPHPQEEHIVVYLGLYLPLDVKHVIKRS